MTAQLLQVVLTGYAVGLVAEVVAFFVRKGVNSQ